MEIKKEKTLKEVKFGLKDESKFGLKDGSQRGRRLGGRGRNQTLVCRHPKIKKRR